MLTTGRTIYLDSKIVKGKNEISLDFQDKLKFIGVHLYFDSKPEIYLFSSVNDILSHAENKDNYYCYLEYDEKIAFILEKIDDQTVIGGKNVYSDSGEWRLFINSKTNIVVQQDKPTISNTYFRHFPSNINFYISLSYLYYVLRNYKIDNNLIIKSKFESLTKK
ncbi:hypothetical protein [Flavobacterium anhuiense]|uniref:hypothetical protein n=1 Tax=Flavobacterium anhuiense TaxID=459526 RepID=UPI003D9779A7